jgi:geranylgeranyl pyrophosphate synthase
LATVLPTRTTRALDTIRDLSPNAGPSSPGATANDSPGEKPRRRKTSHLKIVPEPRELRERLKSRCVEIVARLEKSRPLGKDEMESLARQILDEHGLPEGHVGWTMVVLATEFWRSQVAAVPHNRRLLLLPHCLKHAEGCPADYDEFGLDCRKCGACSIADYRTTAEKLGYRVLVAEGSPIVLKIIVSGYVDAIVGVACLNVLEKAIDKILLAGIPCMAVPLLSSDCRNTSVDDEWVSEMISLTHVVAPAERTSTYVHLMRAATKMFEREDLERLAPRQRGGPALAEVNGQGVSALDPIAGTEAIAYDFLAKGGKHSRPFITLAVYDALTGGHATGGDGASYLESLEPAVKRVAMSIETFHKASLVHDDIEDDDAYRYGDQTLHRKYGTATAINVGDYLIGMGYRLVSREAKTLGAEVVSDILDRLADAHLKLSEGQGAELLWRDSHSKQITPLDALKIYALKTAPAFEAAMFSGLRLAGPIEKYLEPISQFARHLGVAFQILNDLGDWRGDNHNKLIAAGDVLGGRPTVLWALALEGLSDEKRAELQQLVAGGVVDSTVVAQVRALYQAAGVFEKAGRLVDKYRQRAEAVADAIEPDELRQLLYYLIDTVLADDGHAEADEPQVLVESIHVGESLRHSH